MLCILVVEDHEGVRSALMDWLSAEFPRCHLKEATDGEEAIALAQAEPPDVVIMDIGLPGMNGIEATRLIKAELPDTQVVVLSIHTDNAYRVGAAAAGARAFVPKYKMTRELVPVLETLLRALRQAEDGSEERNDHG